MNAANNSVGSTHYWNPAFAGMTVVLYSCKCHSSRYPIAIGLALVILLVSPIDSIAETTYYPDFQQPFDFSLSFSNSDIDLHAGDRKHPVSLDRIGIWVFTRIEPHLQLGFITGSSNLSLDNDPPTAGMSLSGYHAGLAMRSAFGRNPQIGLRADYLYQETKDETGTQTATLNWYEWSAGVFGKIVLGQLVLSAGWAQQGVDARRRATGSINDTQSLKLKSASQGQLGIAWLVSSGGRVSLMLQRGSYKRVEFRFSRKFQ